MNTSQTALPENCSVIKFAIKRHFENDINLASIATGYSTQQIKSWLEGKRKPRDTTVDYFLSIAMITEFEAVCEYYEFDSTYPIKPQVRKMLNGHHEYPGLYAFYDSIGRPLYIGKATNLEAEIISALSRGVENISFPKGITAPKRRSELVKFISAYNVGNYSHIDYPKHVESLILRISKPLLNKNIGTITKAIPRKPEE